ncbi:hypothetical protein [Actinoplanes sp. G11-F43]|uniref:hypothetical protein n=1 Tax=Actinoplanes sp. G11-F43 TaxID=3424130 RepID=UPI003D34E6FC
MRVQILIKIVVALLAGGVAYLLTNITEQPKIWQITLSVFVGGVVLVVQFLIEVADQLRRNNEKVGRISEAAAHLAGAEGSLGRHSLTRLVEAAARLESGNSLQNRFARRQGEKLSQLFEGLKLGRAEHPGDAPEWMLGLTETATASIAATSMTSFEQLQGFVDEGDFWESDLGIRYLEAQRHAIRRKVHVRRLFVLHDEEPDEKRLARLLKRHTHVGVDVRTIRLDAIPDSHQHILEDFIIFDREIGFDFKIAQNNRRVINGVSLSRDTDVLDTKVETRQTAFDEVWALATATEESRAREDTDGPDGDQLRGRLGRFRLERLFRPQLRDAPPG